MARNPNKQAKKRRTIDYSTVENIPLQLVNAEMVKAGGFAPPSRTVHPPIGDVRLADGRILRRAGMMPMHSPVGPGTAEALVKGRPDVRLTSEVIGLVEVWQCADGLRALGSMDQTPHGTWFHVSFSYADRIPDWHTAFLVRDAFFGPDVDVHMVTPRRELYVSLHPYALHWSQLPFRWEVQ